MLRGSCTAGRQMSGDVTREALGRADPISTVIREFGSKTGWGREYYTKKHPMSFRVRKPRFWSRDRAGLRSVLGH